MSGRRGEGEPAEEAVLVKLMINVSRLLHLLPRPA